MIWTAGAKSEQERFGEKKIRKGTHAGAPPQGRQAGYTNIGANLVFARLNVAPQSSHASGTWIVSPLWYGGGAGSAAGRAA